MIKEQPPESVQRYGDLGQVLQDAISIIPSAGTFLRFILDTLEQSKATIWGDKDVRKSLRALRTFLDQSGLYLLDSKEETNQFEEITATLIMLTGVLDPFLAHRIIRPRIESQLKVGGSGKRAGPRRRKTPASTIKWVRSALKNLREGAEVLSKGFATYMDLDRCFVGQLQEHIARHLMSELKWDRALLEMGPELEDTMDDLDPAEPDELMGPDTDMDGDLDLPEVYDIINDIDDGKPVDLTKLTKEEALDILDTDSIADVTGDALMTHLMHFRPPLDPKETVRTIMYHLRALCHMLDLCGIYSSLVQGLVQGKPVMKRKKRTGPSGEPDFMYTEHAPVSGWK